MPSGLVRAIQTKASITTSTGETDAGSEVGAGGARKRLKLVTVFGDAMTAFPAAGSKRLLERATPTRSETAASDLPSSVSRQ